MTPEFNKKTIIYTYGSNIVPAVSRMEVMCLGHDKQSECIAGGGFYYQINAE